MNDLRSRNRGLAAVPDEGAAPTSTPPRVRPETEEQSGRRMSRRQSIAERARQMDPTAEVAPVSKDDHKFKSSRPAEEEEPEAAEAATMESNDGDGAPEGPSSRPNRRRDVAEEAEEEEDRFPWHFQFDNDEPEELQASSPLLSRAFRATTG